MSKEDMKIAFREVMEEERKKHWVDSQTHYEHHRFIKGYIWFFNIMKKSAIVAFVGGIIAGILAVGWAGIKALVVMKEAIGG